MLQGNFFDREHAVELRGPRNRYIVVNFTTLNIHVRKFLQTESTSRASKPSMLAVSTKINFQSCLTFFFPVHRKRNENENLTF